MAEKNRFDEVISKCWQDTAFKQRFLTDPKKVLAEYEIEVPDGLNVKVVENTRDTMYITLPQAPGNPGELSDGQLDAVSGGAGTADIQPNRVVQISKFRTKVLVTQVTQTCTSGKECVPW